MMQNRILASLVPFFGLSLFLVSVHADETKVPLDQVPAAVKDAVKKKFPDAKMEEAEKEVKDGKTTFELVIKEESKKITVSLKEDGTILEIEKEIAAKDLPEAVASALKSKYPSGTVKKAEEVTVGEKVAYEVIVAQEGKKNREIALDKTGKITEDKETEGEDD
jgi:peptidyl-tRNA hydrolase